MTMCADDCTSHYGCRLRGKGLQVSPRVSPKTNANWKPTPLKPPSHYANFAYEDRPGGFKSPIFGPDRQQMRAVDFNNSKAHNTDTLARIRQGTALDPLRAGKPA